MKKNILFLSFLLLTIGYVFPQTSRSMSGTVLSDDDGTPVAGATVLIQGSTNKGVITDVDGRFTLNNILPNEKYVVISYIGYESQTVAVKPKVTIRLKLKTEIMDEVLVVAFGKQKRESFTGSAGVMKSDELMKRQVSSPISALNGTVAGLQMIESNSPTGNPTITIRGIGSINAGTTPLIVLDGLPYSGYWTDINPADVESITVLKDAASNALYGARGANGVILITTKNARRGKTQVSLEAKWGVNKDARVDYETIDDVAQYYETHYKALYNYYRREQGQNFYHAHQNANSTMLKSMTDGGLEYIVYDVPEGQYLIGENGRLNPNAKLGNVVHYAGQDYLLIPDDWSDYGIRNGIRKEYNLNLNGGNDRYSFYGSLGYLGNEGICYGSELERYTARLKTEYQAYPWLKIGANAGYTHSDSNNMSGAFSVCHNIAPIYPLFIRDANGNILTDANGPRYDYGDGGNAGLTRPVQPKYNPIQDDRMNNAKNNSNAFNVQGYADITFLRDFKLTINGSVYITENRTTSTTNPFYGYNTTNEGTVRTSHYRTLDTNYQQLLNYNRSFGRHNVSALLGHEYTRQSTTSLYGSKKKMAMYFQNQELDGAIVDDTMGGNTGFYNSEGYFLRAQYDYDNLYFFSGSIRRDGSSRFHPDHRWGNFWSLGAAWILTREAWFPKSDLVNMLKFKISYGEQGNDQIGDFRYTDFYSITSSNDNVSYGFSRKGNKDISWETVGNFNTGIEFELFKSRLSGSVEYYKRTSSDMLMFFAAPYSIGYTGYYDNVGDMVNKGVEIDLTGKVMHGRHISWSINANLAWQKNEVTKLAAENKTTLVEGHPGFLNSYTYIGEGLPLNTWYLKKYAGVNESGQSMWYYTKDGTRQTTTSYDAADYYLCDTSLPDFFGGFGTTLSLYGFDVSANFVYSVGGKKWDNGYQSLMAVPTSLGTGSAIHKDVLNSWSEENTTSSIPRWQYADVNTIANSDRWLIDASALTFKNLTVGYTLPERLTRKCFVSKLRVYVSCENVAYWTKRKGFDPRSVSSTASNTGYSPIRSITGGINLQF